MSGKVCKVMIALSVDSIYEFVERQIKVITKMKTKVVRCADIYALAESVKSEQPALLIVSPNLIGDPMVPLFKERCGIPGLKIMVYCVTLSDEAMVRNFDGKLLITDTEADATDAIEKVLALNDAPDETREQQTLTPREKDIVVCVVKGLTNKEIAAELYLSTHTVITHRRNIAKKLQIHSPAGLTIYAIVNKLVEMSDINK